MTQLGCLSFIPSEKLGAQECQGLDCLATGLKLPMKEPGWRDNYSNPRMQSHTELRTYQVLAARLAQGLLDGEPRSLRCYWPSKTWFWNVLEGRTEGRHQGSAPQQGEDPGWVKDVYLGDSVAWLSFLLLSHPLFQCFVSIGWHYNGRLHISYVWNLPKENGPTMKSHSVPCLSVLFSRIETVYLKSEAQHCSKSKTILRWLENYTWLKNTIHHSVHTLSLFLSRLLDNLFDFSRKRETIVIKKGGALRKDSLWVKQFPIIPALFSVPGTDTNSVLLCLTRFTLRPSALKWLHAGE